MQEAVQLVRGSLAVGNQLLVFLICLLILSRSLGARAGGGQKPRNRLYWFDHKAFVTIFVVFFFVFYPSRELLGRDEPSQFPLAAASMLPVHQCNFLRNSPKFLVVRFVVL